jgi:hypothetical protein
MQINKQTSARSWPVRTIHCDAIDRGQCSVGQELHHSQATDRFGQGPRADHQRCHTCRLPADDYMGTILVADSIASSVRWNAAGYLHGWSEELNGPITISRRSAHLCDWQTVFPCIKDWTLRRQCQECATERQLRLTDSMSSLLDLVSQIRLCVNFN